MNVHAISNAELEPFLSALGDIPETVISIHQLRNNIAQAYVVGTPEDFTVAAVQYDLLPQEPVAFGNDAQAIWAILQEIQGWDVIQVDQAVANELSTVLSNGLGCKIKHYADLYFQLDQPVNALPDCDPRIQMRLLDDGDLELVKQTTMESKPNILGTIEKTLQESILAGAIFDNELIGFAESRASDRYVEFGVMTHRHWRGRGIASALSRLLIQHYKPSDLIPLWSTGEDNVASQRVALKLGFREIMRRIYLIAQDFDNSG